MHFDTDGIYTLQYTAEDSCGNETVEERTVEVVTLKTTLFTDGTFIINEKSTDRAANIALYGAVTNEYPPCNPNGTTNWDRYEFEQAQYRWWDGQRSSVRSVKFGSSLTPPNMENWFSSFTQVTSFDFTGLDTSSVISMKSLFRNCYQLTSLDLSSFDTSSVTNMQGMFGGCWRVPSLGLSTFNTSSVTNMQGMFENCYAITSLDLSTFNTSSVTDMQNMFHGCRALTSLDLSSFDTSSVTNMQGMFDGCQGLTSLDLSSFDTSSVTNMQGMFPDCVALTSLDLSSFDTSSVTNMQNMFIRCTSLQTIFASSAWVTTQVSSSTSMFENMTTNLVGGAGTRWVGSNPTDKTYAHIDGGTSDPGYFTAKS